MRFSLINNVERNKYNRWIIRFMKEKDFMPTNQLKNNTNISKTDFFSTEFSKATRKANIVRGYISLAHICKQFFV